MSGKQAAKKKKGILSLLSAHCYLLIVLLSLPLFLTPFDHKIYDLFLRTLPSLKESEKVWVLTLDDDSMDYAGGFPFRREVMADVVILLKELGTASITFDLSYLDESPYRLDPDYASEVFSRRLDEGFGEINETALQVIDGFASGSLRRTDGEIYKEELVKLNDRVRGTLEESLASLTRDVDAYFAQALGLTNCSYLTLTMIDRESIIGGAEIPPPSGEIARQLERIALVDIYAFADSITPDMAGVMPAIPKLLRHAKGAGTVNASSDADGIRRRIHLLMKLHGNYFGSLILAGMNGFLDNPSITVNNNWIMLNNAAINGERRDIRIPRARDGSVLIKWPKKSFYDYNQNSLLEFIQHTIIEPHLAENFSIMSASGFFSFYDGEANPWELYADAEDAKEKLLEGYSPSLEEEWLSLRTEFFTAAEHFLTGGYEDAIFAAVAGDAELENYVREIFTACKDQLFRMIEIRQNASYLDGAFCVIGSDATSMTDYSITPFEEDYPNVGTYAALANMLLAQEFLDEAPLFVSVIIALVFSFCVVFIANNLRSGRSLFAGFCGIVLLASILLIYFHITKQYIAAGVPIVSTALSFIVVTAINFLGANREKAFLHSAFSRYLSPQVINEIIANPAKLNLGGEKREMTAIFTDIQGFSTISEKLDPVQLVRLLNRYLTTMSDIIMENIGTVDKYEGDAIIAFFGAPLPRSDHAALACRSALAMKKAEARLNKIFREEGLSPVPLFTRIGINSGEMVVGNMGAENKMDYTIMGNAVNLTARLEGVNKQYQTGGILISEYTHKQAGAEFVSRKLDRIRVVGIHTPFRLYELLRLESEADDALRSRLAAWDKAVALFEERRFAEAEKIFIALNTQYNNDRTAKMYAKRCAAYKNNPPPEDWDGVNNLTEK